MRQRFPKLDMSAALIRQFAAPPHSPRDCVFALTTRVVSADLETAITPCQFGGEPDCASCGCMASMGLAALAAYKFGGVVPLRHIFRASIGIGRVVQSDRRFTTPARSAQGLEITRRSAHHSHATGALSGVRQYSNPAPLACVEVSLGQGRKTPARCCCSFLSARKNQTHAWWFGLPAICLIVNIRR